ncbi:MAG: hypothetical protein A2Z77_01680 [Chloroflexi bacterium RBG_13_51_36]|nr:MAG: hypothetical protein A2Z77_01680 [Chloroflexi bacterium RBG_13_51_36]
MAGEASQIQHPVTDALMATLIQRRYGLAGDMVRVVVLVVVLVVAWAEAGIDGDYMDILGSKS